MRTIRLFILPILLVAAFYWRFSVEIHKFVLDARPAVQSFIDEKLGKNRKAAGAEAPKVPVASNVDIRLVTLNNKREIKGVIQRENASEIVLDIGAGTVRIARNDIVSIQKLEGAEKNNALNEFRAGNENAEATDKKAIIKYRDADRIIVPVLVDNKVTLNLILDTGAPYLTIIPGKGNQFLSGSENVTKEVKMQWTNNAETVGKKIVLRSVKIGGIEINNIIGVISDVPFLDRGTDGLLGMSALDSFHVKIDTAAKQITLERRR
jgi:predicted aspartyl protease